MSRAPMTNTMRSLLCVLVLGFAFLSGCTEEGDPDPGEDPETSSPTGPGPGFAPQGHHDEAESALVQGIFVAGDLRECEIPPETNEETPEAGFCIDAVAENRGNGTAYVQAICVGPWSENMTRDGDRVPHREPMVVCAAFRLEPFRPGDQTMFGPKWNGTLWSDEGQRYEPAPQGEYLWRVWFEIFTSEDGDGRHQVDLEFPVVIGAT